MNRWFRWYEGTCEDGKFRVVARNAGVTVATVTGVWAMLLEDASHVAHRGVATRGEDYYAAILEISAEDLAHILEKMDDIKLIDFGEGNIIINQWKQRQFETDAVDGTNAQRQRKFREKQKGNEPQPLRNGPRNGSVTAAKRPDTESDTDTEADKKDTREVALSDGWPSDFENLFWELWPNPVGKKPALKALAAARKRGELWEMIMSGLGNYIRDKPPDRPWLNPATFLNQCRWEDQPAKVQNGKTSNVIQAADNLVSILDAFNRGAEPEAHPVCSHEGAAVVRFLPKGGG